MAQVLAPWDLQTKDGLGCSSVRKNVRLSRSGENSAATKKGGAKSRTKTKIFKNLYQFFGIPRIEKSLSGKCLWFGLLDLPTKQHCWYIFAVIQLSSHLQYCRTSRNCPLHSIHPPWAILGRTSEVAHMENKPNACMSIYTSMCMYISQS